MALKSAIPALPVRSLPASAAFYRDRAGFEVVYADDGIVVLRRDDVFINLWEANRPDTPGAEPFLAGSASCRIVVTDIDALYEEYRKQGVIHPNGAIADRSWGERDFTILDLDRNALTFAERR